MILATATPMHNGRTALGVGTTCRPSYIIARHSQGGGRHLGLLGGFYRA